MDGTDGIDQRGGRDAVGLLLDQSADTLPESRAVLRKLKTSVAAETRGLLIRNDALLERYRSDVAKGLREP
ncbi:MAG: hypothetical protein HYW10_06300, partial [Candidatus Omnitrophica bacterium]|nr:hypothetical protein [Candidatus Omnitrophota bacterium]